MFLVSTENIVFWKACRLANTYYIYNVEGFVFVCLFVLERLECFDSRVCSQQLTLFKSTPQSPVVFKADDIKVKADLSATAEGLSVVHSLLQQTLLALGGAPSPLPSSQCFPS